MSVLTIARNALRPGYGIEMVRKLLVRWRDRGQKNDRERSIRWSQARQADPNAWATSVDSMLWSESLSFAEEQSRMSARRSEELGMPVGGAGFSALLYFLTRHLRPGIIVETGVAFGFSSRAFLMALTKNELGHLYSSDFPYFRQSDPERLIGVLVEPSLRERWTLLIRGDRLNLPRIAQSVDRIDLLHYDSDKSRSGREFALSSLGPQLSDHAVIVFDDIQDNLHFRDLVESTGSPHLVFEYMGKWIGVTGGPPQFYLNP